MKRMNRSPTRNRPRKAQGLQEKLSSNILLGEQAAPGGPEHGGAEKALLYDIDEDDGHDDVVCQLSAATIAGCRSCVYSLLREKQV